MITQTRYISNFIEIQKINYETKDFIEFENIKLKCCDYKELKELLEEMKEEKNKSRLYSNRPALLYFS